MKKQPGTEAYRFLGQDVRSKELPRHVSGRGRFVDDNQTRRMAFAAILRSPYPHARIRSVDASRAAAAPGVLAVLTPEEIRRSTQPFKMGRYAAGLPVQISEYAMAVDKVRYVGEPVAAVVATDAMKAEDALELIDVDYEPLDSVVDPLEAMRPNTALVFEECGSNVVVNRALMFGDVDAALREADVIVRGDYRVQCPDPGSHSRWLEGNSRHCGDSRNHCRYRGSLRTEDSPHSKVRGDHGPPGSQVRAAGEMG